MSKVSPVQNNSPDSLSVDEAPERPVPLWRNRDFLLLMGGQAVSSVGSQVSLLAFPLLILALTRSPAQAGLITGLRSLPFALFCLPAGALVDRWNRKRVMILCDTGRALALGSIPIAFALGELTLVQLYLVSLIEGTLFAFFNLAEAACLPRVVSKEQLPAATAQDQTLYAMSGLLGPSLSGALYSTTSTLPFLADAVSYAVSVFSLFFIKTEFQGERTAAPRRLWSEVLEGMNWLWRQPVLRFITLLTFGLTTPCVGYVLILIILAQNMHASTFIIGLILAFGGAGSILGSLVAIPIQKRFSFGHAIIGSSWIWALSWLGYAIAPNLIVLGLVNAIGFIIVPVYTVLQYSYRLALIPDELQGRVNSLFRLSNFGSQPIGLMLTGVLLQAIGPVPTVLVLFVPQFVLCIAASLNPDVRNARRVSEV
jgi:predicted MFS family arabinose efflux permease